MKKNAGKHRFKVSRHDQEIEVQVSLVGNDSNVEGAVCFVSNLEEVGTSAWMLPDIEEMNQQFNADLDHSYYGIYILGPPGNRFKG